MASTEGTPSASSGDLFGKGEMLVVRTVESHANALGQLLGAEQPIGFHHCALA
jgi:hypothetical protein